MAAKKQTRKKAAKDKGPAHSLPQSDVIPAGMKQIGAGFAPTWTPVDVGDSIHGVVSALPKEVIINEGVTTGKNQENRTRTMEVTDMEGTRHSVWDSAVLNNLFDAIEELGEEGIGQEIFIHYDGLGKKKGKNNPPKLFTVAMTE